MREKGILAELLLTFMKIGLFTFGGGYAMIALIEHSCVEQKQWISHDEMMNITVIAESTPGPIAINCATYVGWQQAGFVGAVAATAGMVLPSFLLLCLIAAFFEEILGLSLVAGAFRGIRLAVGVVILDAGVTMVKKMHKKAVPHSIMAASCAVMLAAELLGRRLSTIPLMLTAALVSVAIHLFERSRQRGGDRA